MNDIRKTPANADIDTSLAQADSFFKNVATWIPGMLAVVRAADMKLIFVNQQFEHYLGYSNNDQDIIFTDLLESNQISRFKNQLAQVKDELSARSTYVMYKMNNKKGNLMSFYTYVSPVLAGNGTEELFSIVLQPDLSKWGMPFTSFETKELFLEQFDSEDFGTFEWIFDADKVYWSPGVYRMYEVADEHQEVTLLFARSFVHPLDKAHVKEAARLANENDTDLNIEFRIITAKQNVKLLHGLARTVKNAAGKPIKFVGSIRDITTQRQIEDNLKSKVEALNHSNKELEEFAYVASHDMQEPLRKITTFSDRLSDKYKDKLAGDGSLYLSRIIVSANNMRRLINDLLDFSRISKSVQPFEPVNLNFILRQVKTDLELVIEETGTVINAPVLPSVSGIGSQLKQLLDNIINNAIKFRTGDVTPVINIDVAQLTHEEKLKLELPHKVSYIKLSITDNGIGFDNEYAARIFQVFQRLHGKSEYPGSGIGLAICKKILDNHHGVIYAESQPGSGASFIIILPGQLQTPK